MISYSAKKSQLYKELDQEQRKEYFDLSQKAFLHNIDTLYYVIKLDCDFRNDKDAIGFKSFLAWSQEASYNTPDLYNVFSRENVNQYFGNQNVEFENVWTMNGVAASKIYRYDLQQQDRFAMFIANNTPSEITPEIIVQLRSQFLWLHGSTNAVLESLKEIENMLSMFNLKIREVKENRIDYAYHTNYIQSPTTYFKHQNIAKMQHSRFTRGSIEFSFRNQFVTETDYLTLGRKKSNNLFFRIYDKTKEVIQQQYKQFFIELWYQHKMISFFDKYCIEKAFLNPSADNFKYLDVARLEFYLDYGSNQKIKEEIRDLLSKKSKDYSKIIPLADMLTPNVTKVLNVEIETKRKFYSTLDHLIDSLLEVKTKDAPQSASKLFRILDNKKLFHDFLTRNTVDGSGVIRFLDYNAKNRLGKAWKNKRDFPTSDFWKRLQSVSMDHNVPEVELVRKYQKNLNVHLLKKRLINQVSTFSLYKHGENENSPFEDALDFISTINETDLEKANQYKANKFLLLSERLMNTETSLDKVHDFGILNMATGELISGSAEESQSSEYVDYNIDDVSDESFMICGPEDIKKSLLYDLEKEKQNIERMLKKTAKNDINTIKVLYLKLDKILEKLSQIKKM